MENNILELENRIQGCLTRMDELHWNAPSHSIHIVTDDFKGELGEFNDALMENLQAIHGFIKPGDLNPVLPEATEFEDLLVEIRLMLMNFKKDHEEMAYTGANNAVDDFWQVVNKYIYLIKVCKKEGKG